MTTNPVDYKYAKSLLSSNHCKTTSMIDTDVVFKVLHF